MADSPNLKVPCDRCWQQKRPCKVRPPRPAGRKPGALGKYRGVDKAIRKLQAELRKSNASSGEAQLIDQSLDVVGDKPELLALVFPGGVAPPSPSTTFVNQAPIDQSVLQPISPPELPGLQYGYAASMSVSPGDQQSPHQTSEPISNPLGLLADACGEVRASDQVRLPVISPSSSNGAAIHLPDSPDTIEHSLDHARRLLSRPGYISIGVNVNRHHLEVGLKALLTCEPRNCRYPEYFRSCPPDAQQDTGPDLDPIDQGLVTMADAEYLFPIFYSRLHPVNGILDPLLHTPEFVRERSALLFTWLMAIAAQFDSASGAVAKRLRIHGERLSEHVHARGFKSVEIVQGYYISLLSANPAKTLATERSWLYTTYAFGVAGEMNLDARTYDHPKIGVLVNNLNAGDTDGLTNADRARANEQQPCGQSLTQGSDDYAERLLRNRERTWLRILLWERAHSAARGKVSAFPETELTRNIESWYLHPLAVSTDRDTCAFVLLRRHLATLHADLQAQLEFHHSSKHWVRESLDLTLHKWCIQWLNPPEAATNLTDRISRTFLRYVYMHGRLATLSYALYCQKSRAQDVSGIMEDCFQAAVTCCEVAVQDLHEVGEPLFCMLAPTWTMISYAAILALRLFPALYGDQPESAVELLALLGQIAMQLERAGTTPSHRFGLAALLGQHLFALLRSHARTLAGEPTSGIPPLSSAQFETHFPGNIAQQPTQSQAPEPSMTTYDPFLTGPLLPCGENTMADEFSETLWQWCGHGFSAWPTS